MPSSSSHGAAQELTLHTNWRTAYVHLHDLGAHAFAESVTDCFALVLDVSNEDLLFGASPSEQDRRDSNDGQVSAVIRAQGAKMSEAERVEAAATACMEAVEALEQFGREKEGEEFAELGKLSAASQLP